MMDIRKLTRTQIADLYPFLEDTFLDDELKPLSVMFESFDIICAKVCSVNIQRLSNIPN